MLRILTACILHFCLSNIKRLAIMDILLNPLQTSDSGPLQGANTPDFYSPGCLLVLFTVGLLNIDCLPDLRGLIN